MNKALSLGFYKTDVAARLPTYATPGSACFDFYCVIPPEEQCEYLHPGAQVELRTGLIPKIPEGYSLRIHPRSGLAFKHNISLVNCEGIIDEDYSDEIKIRLIRYDDVFDDTNEPFKIISGMRIAQGELVKNESVGIYQLTERPRNDGERIGGFGSSGF
jgi:dUTP pyrophosphatase